MPTPSQGGRRTAGQGPLPPDGVPRDGGKLHHLPETAPTGGEVGGEAVGRAAVNHCLFHYPTLYTAGVPELGTSAGGQVWVIPVVLRDPVYGTLGTAGEIRIDPSSGRVIDSTPSSQVVARGR